MRVMSIVRRTGRKVKVIRKLFRPRNKLFDKGVQRAKKCLDNRGFFVCHVEPFIYVQSTAWSTSTLLRRGIRRLDLNSCADSFHCGNIDLHQLLLTKGVNNTWPSTRVYMY